MDTIIITLEDGSKKEYKKGIKVKEIINLLNKELFPVLGLPIKDTVFLI